MCFVLEMAKEGMKRLTNEIDTLQEIEKEVENAELEKYLQQKINFIFDKR